MVYTVLIGLMVLLDLPVIRSWYTHVRGELTQNKDTLIVLDTINGTELARVPMRKEWTGGITFPGVFLAETGDGKVHLSVYGGQTLTFDDTVTAAKIVTNDRYLISGAKYGNWTLIDEKGRVLRTTRFSNVHLLPWHRGLFTASAGWKEDGEELYELWNERGIKAYDGVFHVLTEFYDDRVSADSLFCRRGGLFIVLDKSGTEISRKTLYRVGEPSRENGFTGRWSWSSSRSFDPFMTMGDQERAPEPPWTVPFDSAHADVPIENRLNIRLDTVTPRLFAEKIKAHTVVLTNTSPLPVRLSAFAGNVPIGYQVENDEGDWVSVKDDNVGYCGNSGGFHDLASGDSVLIPIPQFVGATKTRFRVVIPYYDTDLQRSEVSVTWEGSFNFDVPAVRFRNGPYGYLEQIVGAGFAVGDGYQDPVLKRSLDIVPPVKGGFGRGRNDRQYVIPTDRDGNYVPINERVQLTRETTKAVIFERVAKGFQLVIQNRSNAPINIDSVIYEVKVENEPWRTLDPSARFRVAYCGFRGSRDVQRSMPTSYNLDVFGSHRASLPYFDGATPARFRVRAVYHDMSGNLGEAISDVWDGAINNDFDPKYPEGRY